MVFSKGATRGGARGLEPPPSLLRGGLSPPWHRGPALNIEYLFDLDLFFLILDEKVV